MKISTEKIVSISEANQNFSKVARLVDEAGEIYIFKNNKPKYKLTVIEDMDEDKKPGRTPRLRIPNILRKRKKAENPVV